MCTSKPNIDDVVTYRYVDMLMVVMRAVFRVCAINDDAGWL